MDFNPGLDASPSLWPSPFARACYLGRAGEVASALAAATAAGGEAVGRLLERRESMLRLSPLLCAVCGSRQRPPSVPADADHRRVVSLLLAAGARVGARDVAGYAAVHHATLSGSGAASLRLLPLLASAPGFDVDARTRLGRTALHEPSMRRMGAQVEALAGAGADPDAADNDGLSPAFVAARVGFPAAMAAFEAAARARARAGAAARRAPPPPGAGAAAAGAWAGRRAVVRGLAARPNLNGRAGRLGAWHAARGRYELLLPGEDVLAVRPDNLTLEPEDPPGAGDACDGCGARPGARALLRCSACSVAMFCSPRCLRESWAGHRAACAALEAACVAVVPVEPGDPYAHGGAAAAAASVVNLNYAAASAGAPQPPSTAAAAAAAGGRPPATDRRFVVKLQIPLDEPPPGTPEPMRSQLRSLLVYDAARAVQRSVAPGNPSYGALVGRVKRDGVGGAGKPHGCKAYFKAALRKDGALLVYFAAALPPQPF